ncbi:MAG: hypothetical protein QM523_07450 [Candidatus Pacebacteria bacterium]|nr:hypothetical protein [Candidatus Paceibacterota bacterium]
MGVKERAVKHSINFMIVSGGEMPAALQIVERSVTPKLGLRPLACSQTAFLFLFVNFQLFIPKIL